LLSLPKSAFVAFLQARRSVIETNHIHVSKYKRPKERGNLLVRTFDLHYHPANTGFQNSRSGLLTHNVYRGSTIPDQLDFVDPYVRLQRAKLNDAVSIGVGGVPASANQGDLRADVLKVAQNV